MASIGSPSAPRIACLMVPNFALAALMRVEPDLHGIPVAITDDAGPRATISAVSESASRLGVRPGLTAAQGMAICASLVVRTPQGPRRREQADYRRAAQAALCEVAASCSPRVDDPSRKDPRHYGTVYVDVRGTPFPTEHALGAALSNRAARIGLEVRMGVASTKITARLATLTSTGVTVVPRGAERRFLAPLEIGRLDPDPSLKHTLSRWGITRLGELACLSPGAVGTRLGPAGAVLVRQARGEDDTPLDPVPVRPVFEEEIALDHGIDTLEPLTFVLRGCLDRLAARLTTFSLACGALHLSLGLDTRARDERTVSVAAPTTDVKVLLLLVRHHLEGSPPSAPIETIRIVATPAHVRAGQLDLFRPSGPAPEILATTIARLTAICGPGRVGAPAVVDSHRPEALALRPFDPDSASSPERRGSARSKNGNTCTIGLRSMRPPRPIEMFDDRGEPGFVRGRGLGGRVVTFSGPWRVIGEWWTPDRFARDYYDVGLSDGGIYRIYRDLRTSEWFAEGEYD